MQNAIANAKVLGDDMHSEDSTLEALDLRTTQQRSSAFSGNSLSLFTVFLVLIHGLFIIAGILFTFAEPRKFANQSIVLSDVQWQRYLRSYRHFRSNKVPNDPGIFLFLQTRALPFPKLRDFHRFRSNDNFTSEAWWVLHVRQQKFGVHKGFSNPF